MTHGGNNMWTETTRRQYRREELLYASDLTDAEWVLIEPHLPVAKRLGRPRCVPLRRVVEALLYLLRTASPWRLLPHDFPKRSTVQRYFYAWQAAGVWKTINFLLLQQARERAARQASPSAGVIDSQSVKTTESGGPRGYDAGKKINGRKRHIITDTVGHLVAARVHTADIQDRDGAPDLLAAIRYLFPWLRHVFADGGYAGDKLATALAGRGQWRIDIVKRSDRATGFHVLPRRWVVERTFAWLNRNRRLAKDFETTVASSETWIYLASVQLLARRLARSTTNREVT
jgi:transposase